MSSHNPLTEFLPNFHDFRLPEGTKYISVFASGNSIEAMSLEEIAFIKSKTFMFSMNYAPLRYTGHINVWSDSGPTEALMQWYATKQKDCMFLSRMISAFQPTRSDHIEFARRVDWVFNVHGYNLQGHYTIVWLLQMIRKYTHPDIPILIFGLDMTGDGKWYDKYTNIDVKKRGESFNPVQRLQECSEELTKYTTTKVAIYNCNLASGYHGYPKINYRELLK